MSGLWLPIESAPRNVLPILCAHQPSKRIHVAWREEEWSDNFKRYGEGDGRTWRPTHWMPLPEPPK